MTETGITFKGNLKALNQTQHDKLKLLSEEAFQAISALTMFVSYNGYSEGIEINTDWGKWEWLRESD